MQVYSRIFIVALGKIVNKSNKIVGISILFSVFSVSVGDFKTFYYYSYYLIGMQKKSCSQTLTSPTEGLTYIICPVLMQKQVVYIHHLT